MKDSNIGFTIVKRKIVIDCDDCIFHQKFIKRKDEPSNEGCCHSDYAGYVGRDKMDKFKLKNCCGGLGFSAIGMSYRNFDGNIKERSRND